MLLKRTYLFGFLLLWLGLTNLAAQETFPRNGVFDERDGHYAFTNATIYVSPTQKLEGATLIIKEGRIVEVGKGLAIPKDAVSIDLEGKYIYPSFIDLYSDYGMPDAKAVGEASEQYPQMLSNKDGAYSWNEALRPEVRAADMFTADKKTAKDMREKGFGTVLTHQMDGIARGASALVLLGDQREHELILNAKAAAQYSFSKGTSTQSYPSSLMGVIALMRQTYYDAAWYKLGTPDREYNISLENWLELEELPQIIAAGGLSIFRADKLGDEFGIQYIFAGDRVQYRRMEDIKATGGAFIVPINFPKAYDVSDPFDAQQLGLSQMKDWELAPTNPARLAEADVTFCLTMHGLKDDEDFLANLRKAYQFGLSEEDALSALTTTPAKLINMDKEIGTLEKGKIANFIITSGNILSEDCVLYHNWVRGKMHSINNIFRTDIRGEYELAVGSNKYTIKVEGSIHKPDMKWFGADAKEDDKGTKVEYEWENENIAFTLIPNKDTTKKQQEILRFSGIVQNDNWSGKATTAAGDWMDWEAKQTKKGENEPLELPKLDSADLGDVWYPFLGYGYTAETAPKAEDVLIKNATVWTNEKDGILENTDVLIQDGKIAKVGKNLKANGAKEIDGTGKHLTAGIIDEHSHIAIQGGVNEGTQVSSAEVRIGDVVNSEDVNIYRQLAGGVTMINQLHGSANPIGGQAALTKLRWGKLPEEMKVKNAPGFIKFALGENVKQSNWGENVRTRFPQTRMGVEQVYEDYFTRAREYEAARKRDGDKVRRDLDLETVLEILNGERFITCHSYVQSEITMLMRVAERHGFRINTFTHILEGYKIADKMKEHGAGGSTFSDWWAYKYEVMDAIPHNTQILNEMGVVIAINSDDAEMGRRLNQEAAKSVKYANMSEEDAWKLVTLNPAKLLRVDDRVGSIKVGKHADVVLWSDNPLSMYARAEKTFVDGVCYFDLEQDKANREMVKAERNRLIQRMLNHKAGGGTTQPVAHKHKHHYHCGDVNLNHILGEVGLFGW